MKKLILPGLAAICLIVGAGGGYLIGRAVSASEHDHNHQSTEHKDSHGATTAAHMHKTLEAAPGQAPAVALRVTKDAKAGWYVRVDTANFTFTPANANLPDVMGQGHAHLYVDGKIVSRLYGPDFHYRESFTGTKTFKVTLNGNTHADYTVNGQVVSAEQVVTDDRK